MLDIHAIQYLGIERVLQRGTGEVTATDKALLVRDTVSGAYLLACDDREAGKALLQSHIHHCRLLMVADPMLGEWVCRHYAFAHRLVCYQVAYFGPLPDADPRLTVRVATRQDLAELVATYHMLSPAELAQVVAAGNLYLGYHKGQAVGFVGEHPEGSMGLLYVYLAVRRQGWGTALQKMYMAQTMAKGYVPFGQVERDNAASLRLQEKLGMTRSDDVLYWLWND